MNLGAEPVAESVSFWTVAVDPEKNPDIPVQSLTASATLEVQALHEKWIQNKSPEATA